MTREQTAAMWLARWQGWLESGLRMSGYAQPEGFGACSAYRWRRSARRLEELREPWKAATLRNPPVSKW
jgi:hypothetical protein